MPATLLLHVPATHRAEEDAKALARFLLEEGEGVFSRLLVFASHEDAWRRSTEELAELPKGKGLSVVTDEIMKMAGTIGTALCDTFSEERPEHVREALSVTVSARRTSGFTCACHPDTRFPSENDQVVDRLQSSVAPDALPVEQRQKIIRCMYGILFAVAGSPVVSLAQFVRRGEEPSTGSSDPVHPLERLAAALGSPDSGPYVEWSDAVELLRVRESVPVLAGDETEEHILDTEGSGVAVLRGDVNAPEYGLVLALANPTSEVVEISVDRRALGGSTPVVMPECISGDSVYVPQSGSHILSVNLEPYELMWLDLRGLNA